MDIFKHEMDSIISKIKSKIQVIQKILIYKNFTKENIKKIEQDIEIKDKESEINSFNNIIQNY